MNLDAIYEVLKKANRAMTAKELAEAVISSGAWKTNGKTPDATIGARIYSDIKRLGDKSRFVKVSKGHFGLSGFVPPMVKRVPGVSHHVTSQPDLFPELTPDQTSFDSRTPRMTSKLYEPALKILRDAKGVKMSVSEVTKLIIANHPDIEWSRGPGPVRAMLLSAASHKTPIRQVAGVKPPLFYFDDDGGIINDPPPPTPEEIISTAMEEANNALKKALIEKVRDMDDSVFEELVNRLIERLGFGNHVTTPRSRDGGIDGMIFGDSLGLNVVCVQAKHYIGHNVERQEIDAFIGALEGRNGVFVTTSDFSKGAKDRAEHNRSSSRIALIDGKKLVDLMFKYNMGVQETDKRFVIKRIDNDFFEEMEG